MDFYSEELDDTSKKTQSQDIVITPLAMIGEIEEETFQNVLYKNVSEEIMESFKILKIENFVKPYKVYSSLGKTLENLIPGEGVFVPFEEGMKIEVGDMCIGDSGTFYLIDMVSDDKKKVGGPGFKDEKLTIRASKDYGYRTFYLEKKYLWKKNLFDKAFLEFCFLSLPYEDQKLEVNKLLLRHMRQDLKLERILAKEYSEGKYFKEYFQCLDKEEQTRVVEKISILKSKKEYEHFLWNLGFKDVISDYTWLYKDDSQGFIEYFQSRGREDKKTIIQTLFDLDFKNDEVINWLNKNELRLIQEVGMYD